METTSRGDRPLPTWAQRLLDKHPGADPPTAENPMPPWLEDELRRAPLWMHIRGSQADPRFSPPHHLIADVRDEPELLRATFGLQDRLGSLVDGYLARRIERVIFTGAGSAYYTSVLAAFVLGQVVEGIEAQAVESWEFRNYFSDRSARTLLVAQSATGGSFEVVEAAQRARELGIETLAITNTPSSPLEREVEETVVFPAPQQTGPDISVIPTRLMLTYLLAFAWADARRPRPGIDVATLAEQLEQLPDIAAELISGSEARLAPLAERYATQQALLIVGGGPNWFSALEAGLKIEEESSTPCRAYTPGDYHHMAISLLGPERPTLAFAVPGASYERTVTCLRTAEAAGSPAIGVVLEGDAGARRAADGIIEIPGRVDELLVAPLATIVGQLYGYSLGLAKGFNPDCLGTDDLDHARAWLVSFPFGSH
jgi:glucosamine--fructose-6-phosphate aminotransferase (isomerizing)